jgi:hypothetical protein
MYRFAASAVVGALCFLLLRDTPSEGQVSKEPKPKTPLLKFSAFHDHVKTATFGSYKKTKGFRVASKAAFEEMRAHLMARHKNHKVKHTFLSKNGHPIDCVPIEQQPSLQHKLLAGHKIQLKAPALPEMALKAPKKAPGTTEHATLALRKGQKDAHGNEMAAPAGTIPIRRVTLEDLTRFKTLKDYLSKHPSGGGHQLAKPAIGGGHRYAVGRQTVNNFGGSSWLNLWQPVPTTGEFSLSQVWYYGGSPIQTLEGGWQVYPQKYGHNRPVLFIYWTADGYNKTGAYNLDAPGFVQVNNSFVIGGSWNTVSATNGTQYGFQLVWFKDPGNGNWWLWLKGSGSLTAIGYYPKSLYGSGQMSKNATGCDFGGEVTGTSSSGHMGSGAFAKTGWAKAAFQNNIVYYPTQRTAAQVKLGGIMPNPSCYTHDLHNSSGTAWGSYFYFGGPKCP